MKPFFVYILKCCDGSYYTGHTDDIEKRLDEHYRGENCNYTSKRRPFELVWMCDFSKRIEALSAEVQIKKWSRKKKEALITENWNKLVLLAKKKF